MTEFQRKIQEILSKEYTVKELKDYEYHPNFIFRNQTNQITPKTSGKPENKGKPKPKRFWFNNGIKNVYRYECPEGFIKGMI